MGCQMLTQNSKTMSSRITGGELRDSPPTILGELEEADESLNQALIIASALCQAFEVVRRMRRA